MAVFAKREAVPRGNVERSEAHVVRAGSHAMEAAISHAKQVFTGAQVAAIDSADGVSIVISSQGRRREVSARNWTEMLGALRGAKRRLW